MRKIYDPFMVLTIFTRDGFALSRINEFQLPLVAINIIIIIIPSINTPPTAEHAYTRTGGGPLRCHYPRQTAFPCRVLNVIFWAKFEI